MISRRDLLKVAGAAAAGAASALERRDFSPGDTPDAGAEAPALRSDPAPALHAEPAPATHSMHAQSAPRRPLESLTADEADLLTAIVARLIPSDSGGPGAVEAGAVTYIDRSLAGPLSSSRETYRRGLAALERYATLSRGRPFRQLSPADQDSLLIDVETGGATASGAAFDGSSAAFFAVLKAHTWQGTFGDPYYGGNQGFAGWELLGYPGVRTAVTPDDQRLGARPMPLRRSAYDTDMFNKA